MASCGVAMQGTGFCRSCWATFQLIVANPAQLAINTLVRLLLNLIQCIAIPLTCGYLANTWLTRANKPEPLYASIIIVICAFVVASAFALTFSCAMDTLFVCCIRDKGEFENRYMSQRLRVAFGFDKTERREKRAARRAEKEGKEAE